MNQVKYDCGCTVEYRFSCATQITAASDTKVTQAKKGRPLKSLGELMGVHPAERPIQCTWFIACPAHRPTVDMLEPGAVHQ